VLALTPAPLQTAGERAFFEELRRWDTGGAVRAAVVASIPFSDGQLNRRISDAVLLVPEGVAVVRVAEVSRQSGVVTAAPEGSWTIAPQAGPGDVLQLGGGGSTPLDGLMRAGMEVAIRLRKAGLEPGRIARLTVLVGELTGLVPADGDLGEGDQVALLDPRSLLLGIARCSRYSQVDNPRLWTTADVRAALEALGLQGRGPSVEELNGEGFPYSPYVLRRPELLTPAAMTATPAEAVVPVPAQPPEPAPVREQPSPAAIAHAVAASAAAAEAAALEESQRAPAVAQVSTTVSLPRATPGNQADWQAAAPAAPTPAPAPVAPVQRDTVAIDPSPTPTAAAAAPPAPSMEDSGGLGGLFTATGDQQPVAPRTAQFAQPAVPPPSPPSMPPLRLSDEDDDEEPRRGGRMALMIALGLVLLVAIAVGGWIALRDPDSGGPSSDDPSAGEVQDQGPAVGDVQAVDGVQFRVEAVQVDDTCVGHSYGDVATFFDATNGTGLSRALYSAQLEGGPVVVSVSRIQLPDTASARDLRALADRNGSGNINDLLREGVSYSGGPDELSDAEYASAVSGPTVTIVESSWVDPESTGSAADVDRVAASALVLPVPPFA
jgi:hypothetical protein